MPTTPTARPIYIVDDEALLGEMAEEVLRTEGYRSVVFCDPLEALKTMEKADIKPMLLVTDCVMGQMDGLELIQRSRRVAPDLKTILLSGTVNEDYVKASHVNPDRFIPKPYQVQTLIGAVRELLSKSGAARG